MRFLAIETSCDETAAAVVEGDTAGVRVLSNVVVSQAALHARTAGVVPEVAARAHVEAIPFVIDDALQQAFGGPTSLLAELRGAGRQAAVGRLDAIAVTTEPGLRPTLVVGESAARALASAWGKRLIPVNHLAGHIAAAWLPRQEVGGRESEVGETWFVHHLPAIVLIVSGGHTQLWKLSDFRPPNSDLRLLGQTRDDASGEAFDKIARLLGLSYPGGAALSALAEQGEASAFDFPRPMLHSGDDDFSFSGLKTAVYYQLRGSRQWAVGSGPAYELMRRDVAASAQEAIVETLVVKTARAARREGAAEVILTGGVAANERLRQKLCAALGTRPLVVPAQPYCTDNAAMIGAAAVLGLRLPASAK